MAVAATLPAGQGVGTGSRAGSVRAWLVLLAFLVVLMTGVGGATRLTGSGLSITEWKPVTGAVPPLSETAWAEAFAKYRDSSQYRNLNRGIALGEFKFIYWWEWSHRQLGRFIGLAFFVPLLFFSVTGAVSRRFALAMLAVGALGGLQATVGWIMVASGLEDGMIAVAPIKLMLHLLIASLILACLVWAAAETGRGAFREPRSAARPAPRGLAAALVGIVLVQIALGGLVAGSRAGWTFNTWPLMDGRLVPELGALFPARPLAGNLVANPLLVQFNHRLVAYGLVGLALVHAFAARRTPNAALAAGIAGLALAQMALGIVTLVLEVPLWAGLAHQIGAMVLLAAATLAAHRAIRAPVPPFNPARAA